MAATEKPDLSRIWADGAPGGNIIDPDVGDPGKFDAGWVDEIPPFEYFNFLQKLFTQALKHASEQGAMIWDLKTPYPINGWAKGSDGILYRSLIADNEDNDPVLDSITDPKWETLLTTYSDMKTDRKNLVINGNFHVWERSPSIAIPTGNDYLAPDRFIIRGTTEVGGSGIASRQIVPGGGGLPGNTVFFARQAWTGATAESQYIHNIEWVYFLENRNMTLTFLVRSTQATQITSSIQVFFSTDPTEDSLSPETKVVNIDADTWTKVTQKVTYGDFIGKNFVDDSAKTQIIIQHDGTGTYDFDVAQIQFEFGNIPTEFEYQDIAETKFLCQRFYLNLDGLIIYAPSTNNRYSGTNVNLANQMKSTLVEDIVYADQNNAVTDNRTFESTKRKSTFAARFTNIGDPDGRTVLTRVRLDAELR